MNTKFNCPHCNAAIEADETKVGMAADCPACEQLIIIPERSLEPTRRQSLIDNAPQLPRSTRWTQPKRDLSCQIDELNRDVRDCRAHLKEHFCHHCENWVQPFFDYEKVSSGGIALKSQDGLTLYRNNTSTHERVRCRTCGKLLGVSGAVMAHNYSAKLEAAQNRMLEFQRKESRWLILNDLAKTRPFLAIFLRICDPFIAAFLRIRGFLIGTVLVALFIYVVWLLASQLVPK
jgi:phage FluMu protein Com